MAKSWQELTRLTGDQKLEVERVRLAESGIAIEGPFELPPMARLSLEDQVFAAAFIQTHGSIKQMEKLFGVSYPTIKNRLNRIADQLEFVEIDAPPPPGQTLDQLSKGQITVDEAIEKLKK